MALNGLVIERQNTPPSRRPKETLCIGAMSDPCISIRESYNANKNESSKNMATNHIG